MLPFDVGASREERLANPQNRRLHEVLLTIAHATGVEDLTDFADTEYNQGLVLLT
jgi:hypothetical protein